MVHLRGIVQEGWHMVQESKLWYDYIIMVRSGNAAPDSTGTTGYILLRSIRLCSI